MKTEQALEEAARANAVRPDDMWADGGTIANWFASVIFEGTYFNTGYVASLRGIFIPFSKLLIAEIPMAHRI